MKKLSGLLVLLLILTSTFVAFSKPTKKWYKTTVTLNNRQRIHGLMFNVTDSTVVMVPAEKVKEIRKIGYSMSLIEPAEGMAIVIPANQIESVQVRKKGRGWLVPVIGYAGLFVGATLATVVVSSGPSGAITALGMMNVGLLGGIGGGIALMRQPVKKVYPNKEIVYPQENLASLKPYTYLEIWK